MVRVRYYRLLLAVAVTAAIEGTTSRESTAQVVPSPLRVVVSLGERKLWVLDAGDTLLVTSVAIARGGALVHGDQRWEFQTPKGERRVRRKIVDPVWVPPDWHYAEAARANGLRLARLTAAGKTLSDGSRLVIRDRAVGLVFPNGEFGELPTDEHIVFDGTLFIPPLGTVNRRVTGGLGSFALDLGDGYLIHGTRDTASIGQPRTHGCLRVGDDALAWLYQNIPVGARVTIR